MDGSSDTWPSTAVMGENGMVTLPPALLHRISLKAGDRVFVYPDLEGRIVIRKAMADDLYERFASVVGIAGPGPTTDEVLAMTRGEPDE